MQRWPVGLHGRIQRALLVSNDCMGAPKTSSRDASRRLLWIKSTDPRESLTRMHRILTLTETPRCVSARRFRALGGYDHLHDLAALEPAVAAAPETNAWRMIRKRAASGRHR